MTDIDDQKQQGPSAATPPGGRKRFTMKSLGALVDSNRHTSVSMPDRPETTGPRRTDHDEAGADIREDFDDTGSDEGAEDALDEVLDEVRDETVDTTSAEPIDPAPHDTAEVEEATIELREEPRGQRAPNEPEDLGSDQDQFAGDGVDRTDMGTQVTRTGLDGLVGATSAYDAPAEASTATQVDSAQPLARQMLDDEIADGGRLSDPRDVPGIVLSLAKELPAAAAVSVVRIEEEIELVGNSIHPEVDPSMLARVFSGVFRTMQVAAGVLADGPLGTVHDVVIEGEHMDLVLRPLGPHYYLMVLEDRRSPSANLKATRLRMATLAPGLAAILAHDYGEL